MAEPPYKRARRPDSKQMWDDSDRRAPAPSRERDDRRDERDRGGKRDDRDRDRRYRSRSPWNSRDGRGGRDRGSRREEREHGRREEDRGERRRDEKRNGAGRGNDERESGRDLKDKTRERSRDRRRSRSPRREWERDEPRDIPKEVEKPVLRPVEDEFIKSRTATPPVSFKVGRATSYDAQDHDRMDTDEDAKQSKIKGPRHKKVKAPEPEEDEEIIIEDDGMAAMQAMMGFGQFGTTQNKKVPGNDVSAVRKEKRTEYRQYMNRVGGFNRPLSPSHE